MMWKEVLLFVGLNLHVDFEFLKPDKQVTFRGNSGFFLYFQSGFQEQVVSLFVFNANRFLQ